MIRLPVFPRPAAARARIACLAIGLGSCGDPKTVTLEVTTGQEDGSLALDPAVASVEVVARDADGKVVARASAAPGGDLDLGEVPADQILTFELEGTTADGTVVARGQSVSVPVGALDTEVLPLFIQRLGAFARPPGELVRSHLHAPGAVLAERYLIVTGGDAAIGEKGGVDPAAGDYYDLLALAGTEGGELPRAALSLVVRGTQLLAIDDVGASLVNFDQGTSSEAVAPEGLAFGDVSGGLAIDGLDGETFVVGATRPGTPTDAILGVDAQMLLDAAHLSTPRAGAAAVWVDGVGLAIAGGSEAGSGIEVVLVTHDVLEKPWPSDGSTGAAAVVTAEDQITLLGGRLPDGSPAPTRTIDLRCPADCVPIVLEDAAVPEIASRGRAFATTAGLLVVGEAEDGETLAFRVVLGDGLVEPLPLREPRRSATALPAPNGTLAIVGGEKIAGGGGATAIELFFPE